MMTLSSKLVSVPKPEIAFLAFSAKISGGLITQKTNSLKNNLSLLDNLVSIVLTMFIPVFLKKYLKVRTNSSGDDLAKILVNIVSLLAHSSSLLLYNTLASSWHFL